MGVRVRIKHWRLLPIPPASSLADSTAEQPEAEQPELRAAFDAEFEAAELEQQIGWMPPGTPDKPRAAAPSAAEAFRSCLARVGARVILAGEQGAAIVFAVTKSVACVAYDRFDWIAWKHEDFATAATEEQELAADAIQDVIRSVNPRIVYR